MDAPRALTDAQAELAAAAAELAAAGLAPEQLAASVPPRRALGFIPRAATLRRSGEGFLLGAFLVTFAGEAFDPGPIVRATRQVLPGHQSTSAQQRRALRQMALDAGFAEGTTLVLDARRIPLDDAEAMRDEAGPLVLGEDGVAVRWMPSAPDSALRPLGDYVRERVGLLTPRQGGDEISVG